MTGVWESGRPIYARLPGENSGYTKDEDFDGYDPISDPPIARWLTEFWDEFLVSTQGKAANLYTTHLNPATAEIANLDWLSQLCGFTGEYWNSTWHQYVKRSLIANSFSFLWINKGSRVLLEWLFYLFGYNARIFQLGNFIVGTNVVGDTVGGGSLQYYVLVSLSYLRSSTTWQQIELLNRNYGPVYHKSRVCYKAFYVGFSVVGDPVFRSGRFGASPEFDVVIPSSGTVYKHLKRMTTTPTDIRPVMPSDGVLFVATNGQTSFTLPSAPAIPEAVEASLNGLRAVYGRDFSISGLILTWLEDFALVAGDEVEVIYV